MQTLRFLFLAFKDFVTSIFTGAFIGFVVGIGIISIQASDVFRSWQLLDSPVKFTQIVDATAYAILAESTEGKLYELSTWDCLFNNSCSWMETSETELYRDEQTTVVRKDVCQYEGFARPRYKPGNVVECVFTRQVVTEFNPVVYYAILDNGTIWSWPREGAYGNEYLRFLLVSTLIGSVVGIIAGIIIVYRKETNSKYDRDNASRMYLQITRKHL